MFGSAASLQSQDSESSAPVVGAEVNWALMAAELEARMIKEGVEANHAIAAARDEGWREGQHAAEVAFNTDRQENHARIANALEEFRAERQRYFKNVEMEVVRLALAIAARVLHRAAQMDPLFLAGAVRVALDKLADSSDVVLRVTPAQMPVWQEIFQASPGVVGQLEILGDPSLVSGECVLETRLGTIEVGVRAQLEEIEKGFFDLLDQRPSSIAGVVKRNA
jgi:flagellar assembly protein FliH